MLSSSIVNQVQGTLWLIVKKQVSQQDKNKDCSMSSQQIQFKITRPHTLIKALPFLDTVRSDSQLSNMNKPLQKSPSKHSMKVLIDQHQNILQQLRLPSITRQRKQYVFQSEQQKRKLLRVRSCEAIFYNYDVQKIKDQKTNFRRLNFVPRKLQSESNNTKRATPEKSKKSQISFQKNKPKEAFRRKQNIPDIQNNETSLINFIDSFKDKKLPKQLCPNCKNQKSLNQKIKTCVKDVAKMIEQFKHQLENIRNCLQETHKTMYDNLSNSFLKSPSTTLDHNDLNLIFMPQRLQQFVEELSEDISDLFQRQLRKMESRKRSDIGKIIKNIVPKFQRADFIDKNLLSSSIKKKPGTYMQVFSPVKILQKEQQQQLGNSLKEEIQNAESVVSLGKTQDQNNLNSVISQFS